MEGSSVTPPHTGISKIWQSIAVFTVIGNLGLILLFLYLYLFHATLPIEYKNSPFPVSKEVYKTGEEVEMVVDYCKYWEGEFTRQMSFVDGLIFVVPPVVVTGAEKGCRSTLFRVKIPETLPSGTYHISGANAYHVNFTRDRTVSWQTVKFRVVDDTK